MDAHKRYQLLEQGLNVIDEELNSILAAIKRIEAVGQKNPDIEWLTNGLATKADRARKGLAFLRSAVNKAKYAKVSFR